MSRIITFYSYKGGVGRTLALANIGVLLAKLGKRVLLMDWDLEAPGLDRYFKSYLPEGFSNSKGVVHLLHEALSNPAAEWRSHTHTVTVKAENVSPQASYTLSVIPSGVASSDYGLRVRTFSWTSFMEEKDGGPILERWRDEWKQEFDFILIDSRTGITDTGGICTVLLPDVLVLVFTANDQSFEGALHISQSAQKERRSLAVQRPPLAILPLLSRFDGRKEIDLAQSWLERFNTDLKPIFDDWLPRQFQPLQIIELTKVPYVTRFSFGEPLPVLTHSLTEPEFPGFYLENATRLLASDFRDAGRIIDPEASMTSDTAEQIHSLIRRSPLDEVELMRLIRLAEQEMGESPEFADLLNSIGTGLHELARFKTAEPLLRRALTLSEQHYGPDHPHVTVSLSALGSLLRETNRLVEAEALLRRGLAINENRVGDDPVLFSDLNDLGLVLKQMNRLADAELLLRRALTIAEKNHGPTHSKVSIGLNNLANLLQESNRLLEAEPLMRRALAIDEEINGSHHPSIGIRLNNLAALLQETNRLREAEGLMRRALEIDEQSYGPKHPTVAIRLSNLALLLEETNRLSDAEPLLRRALAINEESYGPDHPIVATSLNNLATLLIDTNRAIEAEPLMRRALAICEKSYEPNHPDIAIQLGNLADLLLNTQRSAEAEPLFRRALVIDESSYGPEHPKVATDLNNLAMLLTRTERLGEAEGLMTRALKISEQSYGSEHPTVATYLNNLAGVLKDANRLEEATPLFQRALALHQQSYGAEHPLVARDLHNLGSLLLLQNRLSEAEPLIRRSLRILAHFGVITGHEHTIFRLVKNSYMALLKQLGRTPEQIEDEMRGISA